ncbi:MAG: diacylglycerol kinase, partial [Actinomycetota bacterium]
IIDGAPRHVNAPVTRLDHDLCPDWPHPIGAGGYRVVVTGIPSYQCDIQLGGPPELGDPGVVGTGGRIVNAIPAVCAAEPGLLSAIDLPQITGRGTMRTGRS